MSNKRCDDCHERKKDVARKICPYAEELTGKKVDVLLCEKCYKERIKEV